MDEVAAGVAPSSVHRHDRTLRRMLQVAVEKEKIPVNPRDRVEPPRVPTREMVFLAWEQAIELAEAHPENYRALIYLALDAGTRWGELIGLRRARLDLHNRKVRVTEQLIRMGPGDWLRKEPKTPRSVRSITISPFTATVFSDHLERFAQPGLDGLVFPNRAGNPLISSSFHTNYFKPALEKARVACRFHDLRHTSVALPVSQPERTRRRSRRAWGTHRQMSSSTATAICSPSSTRRSRRHSVSGSSRSRRAGRRTSSTPRSLAEAREPGAGPVMSTVVDMTGCGRYVGFMRTRLADTHDRVTVEVALDSDDPLVRLRGLKTADRAVERWLSRAVADAREAGVSWAAIGEALGVSRQAAWKLYNAELIERIEETQDSFELSEEEAMELAIAETHAVLAELAAERAEQAKRAAS